MNPTEQEHYDNPEAVEALEEGLADANEGRIVEGALRTD